MTNVLRAEPVAVASALRAVLTAAAAFGLGLTGGQVAALVTALEAVLALFVRARVSPT